MQFRKHWDSLARTFIPFRMCQYIICLFICTLKTESIKSQYHYNQGFISFDSKCIHWSTDRCRLYTDTCKNRETFGQKHTDTHTYGGREREREKGKTCWHVRTDGYTNTRKQKQKYTFTERKMHAYTSHNPNILARKFSLKYIVRHI